jgi:hypothetical protein
MTSRAASGKVASLVPLGDSVPEGFFMTTMTMKDGPQKVLLPKKAKYESGWLAFIQLS